MFNLQGSEIIVILLLALVILGPEKLPEAIRKFSQTYAELKKMGTGFQSELKSALDEPMREMRETADLVQKAADPKRVFEEAENEAHLRAAADKNEAQKAEPESNGSEASGADEIGPDSTGVESNGADPDARPMKPVNQIAASMARGPVERVALASTPKPVAVSTSEVLQTPPQGAPVGPESAPPPPAPAGERDPSENGTGPS